MPADLDAILRIEVPVIVVIADREMSVDEVTSLTPGAILELPKIADDDLEIAVSDKRIGLGRAVKVGENFGIRVTYIGDVRERIKAMGGGDSKTIVTTSSEAGVAASQTDVDAIVAQALSG